MSKLRIKVTNVDDFTKKVFKVKNGEVYDVQSEGAPNGRYCYRINSKENRAIILYRTQVESVNPKK